MADQTVRGRFVWHELITPDASASHGFYSKVLGWKTQPFEQDPSYTMFAASTGPLGGTVTLTEGAPHWLPYIGTSDLETTLQRATELGATVAKDIAPAGGGRYAVLTDPQGATFAVYSSDGPHAKEQPPKRGEYSWHELATTDVEGAFDFYSALFGWDRIMDHDMGEMGPYLIFGRNGHQLGGIFRKPPTMPGPSSWLGYVRVKDVNQTASKAQKNGGRLINGPMEVPGGDWIAQFLDPQGAMFAVHALKADMQPAAPPPPREEVQTTDSMAETTVLTDVPEAEAKVRSAGGRKKPKSAAKPAAKKAASKKAAKKKPAKKKAAAKSKAAAKKKGPAVKRAKKSARKAGKAKKKGGKRQQKRVVGKKKTSKKAKKKARKAK